MSEQTAAPSSAEAKKKPPAHEVILKELRARISTLANIVPPADRDWSRLNSGLAEDAHRAIGALVSLSFVLEGMDVPVQHRTAVAAELRAMHAGMSDGYTCREFLIEAANSVTAALPT